MTEAQRDRLWWLREDALQRCLDVASQTCQYYDHVPSKDQAEYRKLERLEAAETVKRLKRMGQ